MKRAYMDLETRSPVDLADCGVFAYAEKAQVLLWAYALEDEPVQVWDRTEKEEMPEGLKAILADPSITTVWHNGASFDASVLRVAMGIDIPAGRLEDTMAIALTHSLPASLDALCGFFGLPIEESKDKDGKRLIRKYCVPRTGGTFLDHLSEPSQEDWQRFIAYARQDVVALREISRRLPRWNWTDREQELFALDQRINRRGMLIDRDLVEKAIGICGSETKEADEKIARLTQGNLSTCRQVKAFKDYLKNSFGLEMASLDKTAVSQALARDDLPAQARELLELRSTASRSSVLKYKTIERWLSSDSRLRNPLQFRGASRTGRYAGRGPQFQNLARPSLCWSDIEICISAAKEGWLDLLPVDAGTALSSALRSVIIAPAGKKLCIADFSNIEGRKLAYLSGEEWKIEAFRAFDRGEGPDLYKATYGRTFGVNPEDVTKEQRQVGKVLELAMGYGGGVGSFVSFAHNFSIDLDELAGRIRDSLSSRFLVAAEGAYARAQQRGMPTMGLSRSTYEACEAVKLAWRSAHPRTVAFWKDCADAALGALTEGRLKKAGKLVFDRVDGFIRMRLPSGRYVQYPRARRPISERNARCVMEFQGMDQVSHKWGWIGTTGPKLVENATQAAACDCLMDTFPKLEAAGFSIVLSIHDEVIAEADASKSAEELSAIMATPPVWAQGLPLAAPGFESQRYRKG